MSVGASSFWCSMKRQLRSHKDETTDGNELEDEGNYSHLLATGTSSVSESKNLSSDASLRFPHSSRTGESIAAGLRYISTYIKELYLFAMLHWNVLAFCDLYQVLTFH